MMNTVLTMTARAALAVAITTTFSTALSAQSASESASMLNTQQMKWGDAPPTLPKGAKIAVLQGDPGKAGPFTIRLMAPANYRIPAHWHSQDENLTIISGKLFLGMGDAVEPARKAHMLAAGGYHYLPAKTHHYAFTRVPTIVQVSGTGPFDITYVDPKEDPQANKKM